MKKEEGVILVASLVVFLFVSILTIAFLSLVNNNVNIPDSYLNSTKALYIAEAGVSDAVSYIDAGEAFSIQKNFADGNYSSTGSISDDGSWTINSTGNYRDYEKGVRVIVKEEEGELKVISWQEV